MPMKTVKKFGRRYPWGAWLVPGRETTLRKGRDYTCRTYVMAQMIRQRACRPPYRGLVGEINIVVDVSETSLTLRVGTRD